METPTKKIETLAEFCLRIGQRVTALEAKPRTTKEEDAEHFRLFDLHRTLSAYLENETFEDELRHQRATEEQP